MNIDCCCCWEIIGYINGIYPEKWHLKITAMAFKKNNTPESSCITIDLWFPPNNRTWNIKSQSPSAITIYALLGICFSHIQLKLITPLLVIVVAVCMQLSHCYKLIKIVVHLWGPGIKCQQKAFSMELLPRFFVVPRFHVGNILLLIWIRPQQASRWIILSNL